MICLEDVLTHLIDYNSLSLTYLFQTPISNSSTIRISLYSSNYRFGTNNNYLLIDLADFLKHILNEVAYRDYINKDSCIFLQHLCRFLDNDT